MPASPACRAAARRRAAMPARPSRAIRAWPDAWPTPFRSRRSRRALPSRARSVLTTILCGAMLALSHVAFAPPAAAQTSTQDPASPATAQALSQGQSYACNHLSLTGPNFTNAGTAGDSYSGQNLANANFAGTALRGTQLQNADLTGADFTGAAMLGVNQSGALLYDGALMKSATIQNANLANATLWNLNLKSAALNGITFDYSNLINAKLSGASLSTDGTYRASSLVKSNLQGADLTGADLSGVNKANAAVALANGVPLFPISNDVSGLQDDLNNGYLTAALNSAFEQHGYALNYCSSPSMTVLKSGQAWDIVLPQLQGVGPKGASYRAFLLAPVPGGGPSLQISGIANGAAAPNFTVAGDFAAQLNKQLIQRAVFSGFSSNRYKLPACRDPVVTANRVQKTWTISADVTASISPVVGYTGFTILNPTPTTLQVYGSQLTAFYQ